MAANLTFDAEKHQYRLDGEPIPSVTQVIELLQELEGIPEDVLDEARVFGQHVHQACALAIRQVLEWHTLDPRIANRVRQFQKFLKDSSLRILRSEQQVYDPVIRVAGTFDVLGMWQDQKAVCLFDIKTSAVMPRATGPQLAAYDHLYRSFYGGREFKRWGLQLLDDDYRLHEYKNPGDWSTFLSCLNLYRWRRAI